MSKNSTNKENEKDTLIFDFSAQFSRSSSDFRRQQQNEIQITMLILDFGNHEKWKGYGTGYSQAVTHPSTNPACSCLTSEIERDRVHSTEYGRIQW